MGLFDLFKKKRDDDPDAKVILQLKKAGSDLSKAHNLEFFLYFPVKDAAEGAAEEMESKGFEVEVIDTADGDDWLCCATKTMVPELQQVQKVSTYFNKLAGSLDGKYDGWGTEVVP